MRDIFWLTVKRGIQSIMLRKPWKQLCESPGQIAFAMRKHKSIAKAASLENFKNHPSDLLYPVKLHLPKFIQLSKEVLPAGE